jgi:hypothetical protein
MSDTDTLPLILKKQMKKILFTALLLCQGLIIAQNESDFKLYESPIYNDDVKTDSVRAIYTSNSGRTGIVRNDKNHIIFDLFNERFSKIHTKIIETDRKETYIGDLFFNNEINVFTETYPKRDIKLFSCYILNLDDKTDIKIELSSTTVIKKLRLFSNEKGTKFSISPNLNYFSITNYTIHRDEIFYHISVFDSKSYELIYDQQINRKENEFYSLSEIKIDDNKNVYLLGESFYDEESPKLKSEGNRHFMIEKFTGKEYSLIDLNLEKRHITSLKSVNKNNEYILYGFYSETGKNSIKGVCSVVIAKDEFKIIDQNLQDLPSQVYADLFGSDKVERKKDRELFDFKIGNILNDKEDNVYLLAEEFYITYHKHQKLKHYDDILILKFNPAGKLDWGRSIYKYSLRPSYHAFVNKENLHIILNSGKNLRELGDGRTKTTKNIFETSALYDFVYKSSGNVEINKIQNNNNNNNNNNKTYYLPNYGNYVDGKFIMIGDSRNERRFMTLE